MQNARIYRKGKLENEGFDPDRISDYLEEKDTIVWLDLCDPTDDELALIGEEFGLHDLALEDVRAGRQRAKMESYGDYAFITLYDLKLAEANAELETSEMSIFAAPRYLITVRSKAFDMKAVVKQLDADMVRSTSGVGYLLHGVLDRVVDSYFTAVDTLDQGIESLEDVLFEGSTLTTEVQKQSFAMRKALVNLRRVVLPMREVVNALLRRECGIVDDTMAPYYQDVYDHVLRASEQTDGLRDLVSNILETNLTLQGNKLNEIMKRLTSWAAIIAVPTAVTGFYGQNVPYPGFNSHVGFEVSVGLMLVISVGLYIAFKKRGWL